MTDKSIKQTIAIYIRYQFMLVDSSIAVPESLGIRQWKWKDVKTISN